MLDKTALATSIKAALDAAFIAAKDSESDGDEIRQNYCNAIADAFDTYIKEATITFEPGTILVAGNSTNQSNVAPLVIADSIS